MAHSTLHLQRQCCEVHKKIFLEALKNHLQHDRVFSKLKRRLKVNGLYRYYEKPLQSYISQTLCKHLSVYLLTKQLPYLMIHLVCYCTAPKNINSACLRGKEENSAHKHIFLEGGKLLPGVSDCDEHMIKHWQP